MAIKNLTYRNLLIVTHRIERKGYDFQTSLKLARNIFNEFNPNGLSIEAMTNRILTKEEFKKENQI